MYTLFIWSTHSPNGTAQGVMDFYDGDSAIRAYKFFFDLAMLGRDHITCITLEEHTQTDEYREMFSATFPDDLKEIHQ